MLDTWLKTQTAKLIIALKEKSAVRQSQKYSSTEDNKCLKTI